MEYYTKQLVGRLTEIVFEFDSENSNRSEETFIPKNPLQLLREMNATTLSNFIENDKILINTKLEEALHHFINITGLEEKPEWDFYNALFLAITTYTTIGEIYANLC